MLRRSRTIVQAQCGNLRTIAIDPPINPGAGSLELPRDLALLPALQMQCNGSSWRHLLVPVPEGVTYVVAVFGVRTVTDVAAVFL